MIDTALPFFTFKAPCRGCKQSIGWIRRTCPHCKTAYPTARPGLYWTGVVIWILGIPSMVLAFCVAMGWV